MQILFPYRVIVEDPARFPRVPTSKPFSGSGDVADDDEYYSDEDEEVRPGNVKKTCLEKKSWKASKIYNDEFMNKLTLNKQPSTD